MRALTVTAGVAGSLSVQDMPEPTPPEGSLQVDGIAVGVCGTDREIAAAEYGTAPPGEQKLILGHESLGRVRSAPAGSGFAAGDLIAGVVRRPDPEPCGACAVGEFDMCRNGGYTERGIKEVHGFGSERWWIEPEYAIKVPASLGALGILVEPASVVAKAWEQVERIGGRAWFDPKRALVTGAGPIGLLGALLGIQRGLEVHVLDRGTDGPKPDLVRALGATYHAEPVEEVTERIKPEIIIEATGAAPVVLGAIAGTPAYGVVCLTGISSGKRRLLDVGGISTSIVLENDAIVGSVNANQRHYAAAVDGLSKADPAWLDRLITRRVPLEQAPETFEPQDGDIKTVISIMEL
ncbi:glucose 1-dehydrogenase [Catelliglobosispora koreensis]|uniref:glucose 1-dehydrogenase n=1 Tax=Catelliglobosispora koreensis TaxID=129052 RepID=UPI00036C7A64|nr:glucose 1-dehydrogenase [Catelliglobosispora koreensis]